MSYEKMWHHLAHARHFAPHVTPGGEAWFEEVFSRLILALHERDLARWLRATKEAFLDGKPVPEAPREWPIGWPHARGARVSS